jgi:catechol-2,3-dioxygenase
LWLRGFLTREVHHAITHANESPLRRGLGEIALRVNNLDAMQTFYEEIIGLPLMTKPRCSDA